MMTWNSIKELVKSTQDDTQHQSNAHPQNSPVDCDGVTRPMQNITWYLYPYHDIENHEPNNWNI